MLNIGPQELIVVLIIALLVVGPSRLPELGRSIGKALREFRKVQDEVKDTFRFDADDEPPPRRSGPVRSGSPAPASRGDGEAEASATSARDPAAEGDTAPTDEPVDAGRGDDATSDAEPGDTAVEAGPDASSPERRA